jgi:hypothetical protein
MAVRFLTVMAGLAGIVIAISCAYAADPNPAMSQPDMTAWRLFVAAARPAATPRRARFETWASDADTFNDHPRWPAGEAEKVLINRLGRARPQAQWASVPSATCVPGKITLCVGKETRRNKAVFDFIVANKLYTQRGLAASFGAAIRFPTGSIEVKAEWIPVDQLEAWNGVAAEQAPSLYYINTAATGGKTVPVALVALHVISKEVPNWTWATFEHWKNPGRCDEIGCRDDFGAVNAEVKANAGPERGYPACEHTGALKKMFEAADLGGIWLNYCLKGSQTNYTTNTGAAVLLGNSVSETLHAAIVPPKSSCITCHAQAASDRDGRPAPVRFEVGVPKPSWFNGKGSPASPQFRPADFVWAVPLCAVSVEGISACAPPPAAN